MILLDTQVLLWHERGDRRLGARVRRAIERAWRAADVAVSAISFWELAMLVDRERIDLAFDVDVWRRDLLENGLAEIPVDGGIGIRAATLNGLLRDPADRIIVATALGGGHRLVTADERILEWTGPLDRLSAAE